MEIEELLRLPIVGAPMAGGPTTSELAASVSTAGGLGFLAAGYKTTDAVEHELARTRELTGAPFGVNLFFPFRDDAQDEAIERYVDPLPLLVLVKLVAPMTNRPLTAAGGIATAEAIRAVRVAGARLAQIGSALMLTPEAGTSDPHRAALRQAGPTRLTRAFSGK